MLEILLVLVLVLVLENGKPASTRRKSVLAIGG
jgi:hypothetical protein